MFRNDNDEGQSLLGESTTRNNITAEECQSLLDAVTSNLDTKVSQEVSVKDAKSKYYYHMLPFVILGALGLLVIVGGASLLVYSGRKFGFYSGEKHQAAINKLNFESSAKSSEASANSNWKNDITEVARCKDIDGFEERNVSGSCLNVGVGFFGSDDISSGFMNGRNGLGDKACEILYPFVDAGYSFQIAKKVGQFFYCDVIYDKGYMSRMDYCRNMLNNFCSLVYDNRQKLKALESELSSASFSLIKSVIALVLGGGGAIGILCALVVYGIKKKYFEYELAKKNLDKIFQETSNRLGNEEIDVPVLLLSLQQLDADALKIIISELNTASEHKEIKTYNDLLKKLNNLLSAFKKFPHSDLLKVDIQSIIAIGESYEGLRMK